MQRVTLGENRTLAHRLLHVADRRRQGDIAKYVDPSSIAVAWLLAHPLRILPVMGTNDLARIGRLSEALRVMMDRQTWFELYTAAIGREVA